MTTEDDSVRGEQISARLAAATPGPWSAADEHGNWKGAKPAWCVSQMTEDGEYVTDLAYIPQDMAIPEGQPCPQEQADAELMAHAPDDLRWALGVLARAQAAEALLAGAWDEGWRARPNARYAAGYVEPGGNPYRAALADPTAISG